MSCSCVYVGDYDPADFSNTRIVKARKAHKCGECERAIDVGESYEVTVGTWDGMFQTFKTCSDCCSIRSAFFCDGWLFGGVIIELEDHIQENGGEMSLDCLDKLTPNARSKVIEMIDQVATP